MGKFVHYIEQSNNLAGAWLISAWLISAWHLGFFAKKILDFVHFLPRSWQLLFSKMFKIVEGNPGNFFWTSWQENQQYPLGIMNISRMKILKSNV